MRNLFPDHPDPPPPEADKSGRGRIYEKRYEEKDVVIPAKSGIYDRNMGGKDKILFDLLRLCFAQSILTLAAVKLVPPLE